MKNLIKLITTKNTSLGITQNEALSILSETKNVFELCKDLEEIEDFIKNNLVIYRSQMEVFNWFYNNESENDMLEAILMCEIDDDMVGSSMFDIILETKENYAKVTNNLYICWWIL